jgi:hypothetical protein
MLDIFQKIDILGDELNLKYKSSNKLKSTFGALISTILIIFAVIAFFYFGSDIYERKNPISKFIQKYKNNSRIYLKNFPLLIRFIGDDISKEIKIERFMTLMPVIYEQNIVNGTYITNYKFLFLEPCNAETHLTGKFGELYKKGQFDVPLKEALCLNPKKFMHSKEQ